MEKAVNEIAKILANGKALHSHIPSIILEENFDVKSLESLQENPSRIRTKVSVSSEKSFIEYVNKFKIDGTSIFYDLEKLEAKAVFDYHSSPNDPKWGDHVANYQFKKSKDWQSWEDNNKEAMGQIEFGAFLERNIHTIAADGNIVSGAELLSMVLAFEETRKSEFKSVHRLNDGTLSFTYTDENSGGKTRLPEEIVLGIQPFHNGDYYQVKAKIRYRIRDARLSLWYELINPEKVIEDAFNTSIENLQKNIEKVDFFEASLS
ncbi:TPA: DUF2303 family protein [Pasteurella multocida]|uniref:DUF2303 domain-containing protein n=6 Tax=Pasteurella multocida TaxID=747 RepID=A0A849CR95_PASMD|nr:DUF2303 family protein [Pasteurella multocida]AXN95844.1 DUF2303 family protein [Pasteurella multocida]AXN99647.1 DUF2303 family protein [Pasteurella multocida]AXO01856.1 DUF2303 family protein [Pasteurella multocida]AXO04077.1 DUF2303 family protein [Pasteurella multocida]MCH1907070.1 YfdQ family protein [Pasteurella multocida]